MIDNIKNLGFNSKSDIEKLEKYCKEHPEFKDDVKLKFEKGDLDITDAKSIKDIQTAYEELIKYTLQKDSSVSGCKKKLAEFKSKCENIDKHAVVQGAKAATVIIGVPAAIITLTANLGKIKTTANTIRSNNDRYEKKHMKD